MRFEEKTYQIPEDKIKKIKCNLGERTLFSLLYKDFKKRVFAKGCAAYMDKKNHVAILLYRGSSEENKYLLIINGVDSESTTIRLNLEEDWREK